MRPKSYNTNVTPVEGEFLDTHLQRVQLLISDTRNNYWMSHITKHYCHYGNQPCYICPILECAENAMDNYRDMVKICGKNQIIFKKGHWKHVPRTT